MTDEVEEAAMAALMAELVEEGVEALGMLNCWEEEDKVSLMIF